LDVYEALVYALMIVPAALAFWLARRLSSRIEERAEKIRELREQLVVSEKRNKEKDGVIKEKQLEIEQLKLTLAEKDKKIAELEERTKFAEKVSERDLDRIKERISDMQAILQKISEMQTTISEINRIAEEERKRK
jgi:hypothetical protein